MTGEYFPTIYGPQWYYDHYAPWREYAPFVSAPATNKLTLFEEMEQSRQLMRQIIEEKVAAMLAEERRKRKWWQFWKAI